VGERREAGTAVHIEDFAQVFGLYPKDKYSKANLPPNADVIKTLKAHVKTNPLWVPTMSCIHA